MFIQKIKLSRFEYAIREAASKINNDPGMLENYEPYTAEEELEMRIDNINEAASKMRIKHDE